MTPTTLDISAPLTTPPVFIVNRPASQHQTLPESMTKPLQETVLQVAKLYKTAESHFTFQIIHQVSAEESEATTATVAWQLNKKTYGFRLTGHGPLTVTLPCDRCANLFEHTVTLDIDETYVLSNAVPQSVSETYEGVDPSDKKPVSGQEVEIVSFDEVIDPHDEIPLDPLVSEYVAIALSDRRLCDNKGCGVPTNRQSPDPTH